MGAGNLVIIAGGKERRDVSGTEQRDRTVGDKMKERPAAFLESAPGFVRWEVVCKRPMWGYENMCVW